MHLHHSEMSGCELCHSPGGGNTVNMSLSVIIEHGVSMMCIENRVMKTFIIIYQAETFARFEGKCRICLDFIELEDPITGVYINGKGHTWDCRTT